MPQKQSKRPNFVPSPRLSYYDTICLHFCKDDILPFQLCQAFKGQQFPIVGVVAEVVVYVSAVSTDAVEVLSNIFYLVLAWEKVIDVLNTTVI